MLHTPAMTNVKEIEKVAIDAAQKAAKILLHYHEKKTFQTEFKGDVNLVTDADIEAEAIVIKTISKAFPEHSILSEENKNSHQKSLDGPIWVIDPLDGTTNFSHGFAHFAISIAFRENSQTVFGIVHQPVLNEVFIARLGGGAFLNGKKISVSKQPALTRSLIATGFPYDRRDSPINNLSEFCMMEMNCQDIRRPGAATLDLAYVACGRLDGYWEHKLSAWDLAAGKLLVEEAGGKVTDFNGKEITDLWNGELISSNCLIHDQMNQLITLAKKNVLLFKNFSTIS